MKGRKFTVACVQTRANELADSGASLSRGLELVGEAASSGASLVLLPEAFYPAYYLGEFPAGKRTWRPEEGASLLSARARECGVYLAAGIILEEGGTTFNGGILWGPDGREILRTRKSNLWHFDSRYVSPGETFDVASTELGPLGMIICADGRIPEICRILALKGARLVLDLANLTSSGRDREKLSNPQLEYTLAARAAENGIWLAVADKVGLEAETVLNCGGSCVIDPQGNVVASASTFREEILCVPVDLSLPVPPLPERFPERYASLAAPTERTRAFQNQLEPLLPVHDELYASLLRFSPSSPSEYLAMARRFIPRAVDQGGRLLFLPGFPWGDGSGSMDVLPGLLGDSGTVAALPVSSCGGGSPDSMVFFRREGEIGRGMKGRHVPVDTPAGRIGTLFDEEGWLPEPGRCLMIEGAEIVLWNAAGGVPSLSATLKIARTRSSENRYFLLLSLGGPQGGGWILGPSGAPLAATLEGTDQGIGAILRRMESRGKTVVPGTNIISGRRPELYGFLTR